MDVRNPYGALLLTVGRIRPGGSVFKQVPLWWPSGRRIGSIRPKGFVYCDFLLRDLDGGVLAVAKRAAWGFRENYLIQDAHGIRIATVIEPAESVRSMGERGALPTSRWLNVEFQVDIPAPLRAFVLALPLVIRMRHGWDYWQ